ncbi:MAG: lysine biosynthesis protein LysW [Thermomicrobiales bacterium]
MSTTITTVTAECPECAGEWTVSGITTGEIIQCPECGAELEVVALAPFTLALAPEEDEDWGE